MVLGLNREVQMSEVSRWFQCYSLRGLLQSVFEGNMRVSSVFSVLDLNGR